LADPACLMRSDHDRVLRRVVPRAAASTIFVVGQGLGSDTQRKSGLPYTYPSGRLSPTGRALDSLLRLFGHRIDSGGELPYAYSSDIVHRYPGRDGRENGDRRALSREVENCSEWLDAELRIMRACVVLLLGRMAAQSFIRRYIGSQQVAWGHAYMFVIDGSWTTAIPNAANPSTALKSSSATSTGTLLRMQPATKSSRR
jgi:uracil-DNA glycosylase family 4